MQYQAPQMVAGLQEQRIVFRGLTSDCKATPERNGLTARDPEGDHEFRYQLNQKHYETATQFISTSKSFVTAAWFATGKGMRNGCVVKVDLEQTSGVTIYDLSVRNDDCSVGIAAGSSLFLLAVKHREVLLEGWVCPEAVVEKFAVRGLGREVSLDDFTERFTHTHLSDIVWAYGAEGFFVDNADRHGNVLCHLVSHCRLASTFDRFEKKLPEKGILCVSCLHAGVKIVEDESEGAQVRTEGMKAVEHDWNITPSTPMGRGGGLSSSADALTPPALPKLEEKEKWNPELGRYTMPLTATKAGA